MNGTSPVQNKRGYPQRKSLIWTEINNKKQTGVKKCHNWKYTKVANKSARQCKDTTKTLDKKDITQIKSSHNQKCAPGALSTRANIEIFWFCSEHGEIMFKYICGLLACRDFGYSCLQRRRIRFTSKGWGGGNKWRQFGSGASEIDIWILKKGR